MVAALVEGASINSIVRMSGISKVTILRLLEKMGCACAEYPQPDRAQLESAPRAMR
jgi:transposase-like protein